MEENERASRKASRSLQVFKDSKNEVPTVSTDVQHEQDDLSKAVAQADHSHEFTLGPIQPSPLPSYNVTSTSTTAEFTAYKSLVSSAASEELHNAKQHESESAVPTRLVTTQNLTSYNAQVLFNTTQTGQNVSNATMLQSSHQPFETPRSSTPNTIDLHLADSRTVSNSEADVLAVDDASEDTQNNLRSNDDIEWSIDTGLVPGVVSLKPFKHQVGGHNPIFRFSERAVCKPLANHENEFYEKIEECHPELLPFMPKYIGVLNVTHRDV
jgi:hypothetical protein